MTIPRHDWSTPQRKYVRAQAAQALQGLHDRMTDKQTGMKAMATDRENLRREHPDAWVAVNEGDKITGAITDVTDAWSEVRQGGSYYPLLTIAVDEADGYSKGQLLKVHAFGTVLHREIVRQRPQVGSTITITYQGKGKAKGNLNAPELYHVNAGGGDADSVYDRLNLQDSGKPVQEVAVQATQQQQLDEDIPF